MLTVPPETTVAELGSFLAERGIHLHVAAFSGGVLVGLDSGKRIDRGTGPDLVTALNDAMGKVRG